MNLENKEQTREEEAIILDVIVNNQKSFKNDESAQAIGTTTYTLLELIPKPDIYLKIGEKVYIGEGKRDKIQYIKKIIPQDKLSPSAKQELIDTLKRIILEKEEYFINFFNKTGPISIRKHSLELINGIGKKHLRDLLEEREINPFKSFEDIKKRCSYIQDPEKAIAIRILNEIEEKDDFKFFTRK